jgi:predicted Zn-dependent peptidase
MIDKLYFHTFDNGVKVCHGRNKKSHTVSLEVWVAVGSGKEGSKEEGMSHMIEHMLFHGSVFISGRELNALFYLIGGKMNAYTSHDFTVYTFSFEQKYIDIACDAISKLFRAPLFSEKDLEREKKVVAQEILLYQDDPQSQVIEYALRNSHAKKNYQHPILGSFESIYSFQADDLRAFYERYYIPSQIQVFVLSSLMPKKIVASLAKTLFPSLEEDHKIKKIFSQQVPPVRGRKKEKDRITFFFEQTENNHIIFLYKLPVIAYFQLFFYKAFSLLLGEGSDSLLYKRLCLEKDLVYDIVSSLYAMRYDTYFFIYYIPKDLADLGTIIILLEEAILDLVEHAQKEHIFKTVSHTLFFEKQMSFADNQEHFFYEVGAYLFEKQRNYLTFHDKTREEFIQKIADISQLLMKKSSLVTALSPLNQKDYVVNTVCHTIKKIIFGKGKETQNESQATPLKETRFRKGESLEHENYKRIAFDERVAKKFLTNTKTSYAPFVPLESYEEHFFDNGLRAIFISDESEEIVSFTLSLEVSHLYDKKNFEGSLAILFDLMREGTHEYPGISFAEELSRYGIEFVVHTGAVEVRCLKRFFKPAVSLLYSYLVYPELLLERFLQLKGQTLSYINNFLDDLSAFSLQGIREKIYGEHPYGANPSGTKKSVSRLSYEYILELYKMYITPYKAFLLFAGSFSKQDKDFVIALFSRWKYREFSLLVYPALSELEGEQEIRKTAKQQVSLCYGGLSAKKYTKDYYALLLAGELFSGSITGTMNSLLFQIREKTGFFYSISGSLVSGSSFDRGAIIIKALTSRKYYKKATAAIEELIKNFSSYLCERDIVTAKSALLSEMAEKNSLQGSKIATVLQALRYGITTKHMKEKYQLIKNLSLKETKEVVDTYLVLEKIERLFYLPKK